MKTFSNEWTKLNDECTKCWKKSLFQKPIYETNWTDDKFEIKCQLCDYHTID